MRYTQVSSDAFQKLQLNAGILLLDFDPATGEYDEEDIIGATSGGVSFASEPEFIDFGEDIDNVPANTKELKQINTYTVTMSGTFKTVDASRTKMLIGAADVAGSSIVPRTVLKSSDFSTIWWVGDYSNAGDASGFLAIKLINALNTSGFAIQSNDKGKGDFAFEFTGHYSLSDIDVVPFVIYVEAAAESPAYLNTLSIGSVTLSPAFNRDVTVYTATTSNSSNTVSATAPSGTGVVIVANGNSIASGGSVTWATGENVVKVTASTDTASRTYRITVTKSA